MGNIFSHIIGLSPLSALRNPQQQSPLDWGSSLLILVGSTLHTQSTAQNIWSPKPCLSVFMQTSVMSLKALLKILPNIVVYFGYLSTSSSGLCWALHTTERSAGFTKVIKVGWAKYLSLDDNNWRWPRSLPATWWLGSPGDTNLESTQNVKLRVQTPKTKSLKANTQFRAW